MRALLDVTVLLALFDESHVAHLRSRTWFEENESSGWASCAVTQDGFLRVISQPSYPASASPQAAFELLDGAARSPRHRFWTCSLSMLDRTAIDRSRVLSSRQITDVFLLALAAESGRLVTLDRRIRLDAVRTAGPEHLVVL